MDLPDRLLRCRITAFLDWSRNASRSHSKVGCTPSSTHVHKVRRGREGRSLQVLALCGPHPASASAGELIVSAPMAILRGLARLGDRDQQVRTPARSGNRCARLIQVSADTIWGRRRQRPARQFHLHVRRASSWAGVGCDGQHVPLESMSIESSDAGCRWSPRTASPRGRSIGIGDGRDQVPGPSAAEPAGQLRQGSVRIHIVKTTSRRSRAVTANANSLESLNRSSMDDKWVSSQRRKPAQGGDREQQPTQPSRQARRQSPACSWAAGGMRPCTPWPTPCATPGKKLERPRRGQAGAGLPHAAVAEVASSSQDGRPA